MDWEIHDENNKFPLGIAEAVPKEAILPNMMLRFPLTGNYRQHQLVLVPETGTYVYLTHHRVLTTVVPNEDFGLSDEELRVKYFEPVANELGRWFDAAFFSYVATEASGSFIPYVNPEGLLGTFEGQFRDVKGTNWLVVNPRFAQQLLSTGDLYRSDGTLSDYPPNVESSSIGYLRDANGYAILNSEAHDTVAFNRDGMAMISAHGTGPDAAEGYTNSRLTRHGFALTTSQKVVDGKRFLRIEVLIGFTNLDGNLLKRYEPWDKKTRPKH